jgi:hypothetical protein
MIISPGKEKCNTGDGGIRMKIYRMNTERFMNRVAESRGDVYLRLADGSLCDLKHDRLASALFRTMEMPEEGIELTFTEAKDVSCILQYITEAAG